MFPQQKLNPRIPWYSLNVKRDASSCLYNSVLLRRPQAVAMAKLREHCRRLTTSLADCEAALRPEVPAADDPKGRQRRCVILTSCVSPPGAEGSARMS